MSGIRDIDSFKKRITVIQEGTIQIGPHYVDYFILPGPLSGKNGYCIFKERPVKEKDYNGILVYVPVHGGITYCEEFNDGSVVYGFDTAHHNSDQYPIDDTNWILAQIKVMAHGIIIARNVEDEYLAAETNEAKAAIISKLSSIAKSGDNLELGFSAMMNLLSGKL